MGGASRDSPGFGALEEEKVVSRLTDGLDLRTEGKRKTKYSFQIFSD